MASPLDFPHPWAGRPSRMPLYHLLVLIRALLKLCGHLRIRGPQQLGRGQAGTWSAMPMLHLQGLHTGRGNAQGHNEEFASFREQ